MDVILHLLQIHVSIRYEWLLNSSFYFISRHTFVLKITCHIRLGIHRPSHFHSPTWVCSSCIFWISSSHVCCFMGRNSLGSEPPTTVGILLLIISMPNTLNLCNIFGGCSKEIGNDWLHSIFFSSHFWEKVSIKGDKEYGMLFYTRVSLEAFDYAVWLFRRPWIRYLIMLFLMVPFEVITLYRTRFMNLFGGGINQKWQGSYDTFFILTYI